MEKLYFTKNGFKLFLDKIKGAEETIKTKSQKLAELCDVGGNVYHDNFSYEQQVLEIRMLTEKLKKDREVANKAFIIDNDAKSIKDQDTVYIGSKVIVDFGGKNESWEIVGYGESDPENHKIAYNSRLGLAFSGKHTKDIFNYVVNSRTIIVKILEITQQEV